MNKTYCDICGNEIPSKSRRYNYSTRVSSETDDDGDYRWWDICEECWDSKFPALPDRPEFD